jgi:hypothetical protein
MLDKARRRESSSVHSPVLSPDHGVVGDGGEVVRTNGERGFDLREPGQHIEPRIVTVKQHRPAVRRRGSFDFRSGREFALTTSKPPKPTLARDFTTPRAACNFGEGVPTRERSQTPGR